MDSNMDYTMHHPNHHHPNYHHPSGSSSTASAARCPALRAVAEQRNYQLPTISPARGATQYDPVHSHPASRNVWQTRNPQNWRSAMMPSPFAQDPMLMGPYSGPTTAPNQPQSEQPCPMSNIPNLQNAPEPYVPPMPSFQQFRTTMHPVPRLLAQPAYPSPGGYANPNSSQSNTQHFSNRPVHTHRADTGLPASAPVNSMPTAQTPVSGPSANPGHMGQTAPFNENNNPGPGPQLPNIPHIFAHPNHPTPFSQQAPQSTAQPSSVEQSGSRLAQASFSPPASTASQHNNDQPARMISPVEIRRASTAAMNRARRSMPRFTATPSEWIGENAIFFRRGDMSLMEFVESYPGAISDGEGPMNGHRFWRGNGSGKRVASKQALASLQSVNMADLPESERTCVICYNDFGVANPEGINEAPLRLPKCKHVFGDHCIKKWFQESDSCPYCRDQVHSELQPIQRRGHPNFRFITPYHISAQHLPGFQQGHDQHQPQDRDASEPESSTQPEQSMSDNTTDSSSILSDTGSGNRPPSGRRLENNHQHSMRIPSWNATNERRSPPVEYDRRRRPRHRARVSPSSTRPSIFGGPSSNGVSQTSYHWNDSPSPNSNYRGGPSTSGPSGAPMFDASGFPFQSQTGMPPDDFFREFLSPNSDMQSANEQSSGLQQTRSGDDRFSSPTNGTPDAYAMTPGQPGSNQFTSYQQS